MASENKLIAVAFLFAFLCLPVRAQGSVEPKTGTKARSAINLLPGYKIQVSPGIDSAGGRIWKEGGVEIAMEMCCGFGNAADSVNTSDLLWREEQTVNGQPVILVFTKKDELIVTFPKLMTNFKTKTKSSRDLAQALLMILSYDQVKGYMVDSSAIVPPPSR